RVDIEMKDPLCVGRDRLLGQGGRRRGRRQRNTGKEGKQFQFHGVWIVPITHRPSPEGYRTGRESSRKISGRAGWWPAWVEPAGREPAAGVRTRIRRSRGRSRTHCRQRERTWRSKAT